MAALSPGPRRASRSGSGREPAHRDPQGGLCPRLCLGACFIPSPQERKAALSLCGGRPVGPGPQVAAQAAAVGVEG